MPKQPAENLFFFYGSLKRGHYNNSMLERGGATYLQDHLLRGYRLYSLGSYPCVIRTSEVDQVKGELWTIQNESTRRSIDGMEKGAGYLSTIIETPLGSALIYYMSKAPKYADPCERISW